MVKVIIENDGVKKELTGEMVICAATSDLGNVLNSKLFLVGSGNPNRPVNIFSNMISEAFKSASDDPIEYIAYMIALNKRLDAKIRKELKESADSVAEILKDL